MLNSFNYSDLNQHNLPMDKLSEGDFSQVGFQQGANVEQGNRLGQLSLSGWENVDFQPPFDPVCWEALDKEEEQGASEIHLLWRRVVSPVPSHTDR